MSEPTEDNPPAFPFAAEYGHPASCGGMTLRDWFAGQALAGLLSDRPSICYTGEQASLAYSYADAMIKARKGHGS